MNSLKVYQYIFVILLFSSSIYLSQNKHETELRTSDFSPEISCANLNGERIFFIKKKVVSGLILGDIYSMNPTGGQVEKLTNFSDNYFATKLPELSRDGRKLTFISNYNSWKSAFYLDAFIIDLQSSTFKRITGDERPFPSTNLTPIKVVVKDPNNFAISPSAIRVSFKGCTNFLPMESDSMVISVTANEDIWVKAEFSKGKGDIEFIRVNAGVGERIDLVLGDGTISAESCSPSFNGTEIAVSVNYENPYFPFYKIGIWNESGLQLFTQDVGGHSLGGDMFPSYSPNGSMIAYASGEYTLNSLSVISTSSLGNPPTILVPGGRFGIQGFCSQPTWSPDGSEIVFVYTTVNGLEIQSNLYKVSVNGGDPTQITNYSWNEVVSKPTYSPDGSKIAFNLLRNNGGGIFSLEDLIKFTYTSNILYLSLNGGQTVALTSDGASIDPSWGIVNTMVDIPDKEKNIPNIFSLSQNFPNPFNPSTNIQFTIPNSSSAFGPSNSKLKVYNNLGEEVAELINNNLSAGEYNVTFNGSNLNSGVYFYELRMNGHKLVKKMLLIK